MKPGSRLIYWIATVLKRRREEAGKKPMHVAVTLDVDPTTIWRFEKGEAWPRDTDEFVQAYAKVLGVDDPRELWDEAMELYHEHGTAPGRRRTRSTS